MLGECDIVRSDLHGRQGEHWSGPGTGEVAGECYGSVVGGCVAPADRGGGVGVNVTVQDQGVTPFYQRSGGGGARYNRHIGHN